MQEEVLVVDKFMQEEFTIGVDDNGRLQFIDNSSLSFLKDLGQADVKRASHVEPDSFILRQVFHYLRWRFGENSSLGEWTREWKCLWRVDMRPSGGSILDERFINRQAAINAEVTWIEKNLF